MEYELVEQEDDSLLLTRSDGKGVSVAALDLMIELHGQNPEFYLHWIRLAESYIFTGRSVLEA